MLIACAADAGAPAILGLRVIQLLALEVKCNFCVNSVAADFSVLHFGSEVLNVDGANVPQRLARFIYRGLRGGLPNFSAIAKAVQ